MNKNFSILCAGILVVLTVSCGERRSPDSKGMPDRRSVPTAAIEGYIVKPGILDRSITVSGTIKPFEETVLMPEVSGRVVSINLPEGKAVKKGTLLIKLFDGDLQAQLKKAKAQFEIAKQTRDRLGELIKINGVSQSDYDQAVLQVSSLSADIDIITVQILKTEVLAPYDGVLGLKNISQGAQVTPQTPLVTIRSLSNMKIDFSIPEKYSREVKAGMKLLFTIEGENVSYAATVIATEQGIDVTTRNLKVRALTEQTADALKSGTFARVTLNLGQSERTLTIPTQAVIPQERDKSVIVIKAGNAVFTKITTGIRQEATVEVTSGLSAGDTIVTTGLLFIRPGMPVKLSKVVQ